MPRQITLNEETWRRLQAAAEPLVESVDDVLNRLLDAFEGSRRANPSLEADMDAMRRVRPRRQLGVGRQRLERGRRVEVEAFKRPILYALRDAGGQGRPKDILPDVERRLRDRLTEVDYQHLAQGTPRWQKTAHFARLELCEAGLVDGSEYGIWKLAEAGKRHLANDSRP